MATTLGIYCNNALTEQVMIRACEGESLSAAGKVLFERALVVLAAETRALSDQFTETEWRLLIDSFEGISLEPGLVPHLASDLEDYFNLSEAPALFGLDTAQTGDLLDRVARLTPAQKWALLDVAERYHAAEARGKDVSADADGLRVLGVRCRV